MTAKILHADALVRPVSVNHWKESAVGSPQGTLGSSLTTAIIAGGSPRNLASRSASNISRVGAIWSALISRRASCQPLINGTCETTQPTRRSMAPTTRTWPPL